jgi:hypothetical protein
MNKMKKPWIVPEIEALDISDTAAAGFPLDYEDGSTWVFYPTPGGTITWGPVPAGLS